MAETMGPSIKRPTQIEIRRQSAEHTNAHPFVQGLADTPP